ncbi:MAG: NAD(P)H-dependent glycerol-3-phosphate dehydrogenase [Haemophilus parainfluenzae]|nr:NAD(P)H-dependent glycerol-3-phosphate dehydrogenase [Haemophilus parainfluenzae]
MNASQSPITILGCGSYGTALAISFSRNGSPTYLWGHNPDHIHQMQQDLETALDQSKDILIVVPSHAFGEILLKIRPHLKPDHRLIWATKGLERNTGRLLQEVVEETLGKAIPTAVLSGPTFAKELAQGLPTAITLASCNEKFALEFQARIHCSQHFRVYVNQDMIGVQLGGAIKNVIAIGAGISDGMGFGANARTALITRGIAEITRLGVSMGANTQTFMGMSGLGDLVLTCTDIYQMLFCGKSAQEVALSLLGRERKGE